MLTIRTSKTVFLLCLLLSLSVIFNSCNAKKASDNTEQNDKYKTIGNIERVNPDFDKIVPQDAKLEILSEGHEWTEGPLWVPQLKMILYSDIPQNAIYSWAENNPASIWLQPAGYTGNIPRGGESGSNGLALDNKGRLILAQHGDRRIARLLTGLDSPQPKFETLADRYDDKRFNSPNDLAIRSNGDIYFTDPPYGLEQEENDPAKEMDIQGVYRIASDGKVSLLIDDFSRPNGITFSPDESVLYVANSDRDKPVIMAYDVLADGNIDNGRVFFDSWGDGIKVDQQGNLYVAGPENGVIILSPQGEHLGTLHTTERTSNCAFGDDGLTLYITADMYLLRTKLLIKGAGF